MDSDSAARVPQHLAVIMDGNGRWAQRRRRPRLLGHRAGAHAANRCIDFCLARGIGALTLYAFSSENWGRPADEVNGLMKLFLQALDSELPSMIERGIRVRFIGERERFSVSIRERMELAEQRTAVNTRLNLNIAASYGGRGDVVHAAKKLATLVQSGDLRVDQIDESVFGRHVALADLPDPDLMIRTGGDQRISNFLLWQSAYTEFWFTDALWPDVDDKLLDQALSDYANRERRFGLTGEQARELTEQPA